MGIVNRIKRLMKADVHGILDAIEDPRAVLKQAIREMEESLDQRRAALAARRRALQMLSEEEGRAGREIKAALENLEMSLKRGVPDLTRKIIARKLVLERKNKAIRERAARLESDAVEMEREMARREERLAGILDRARLFLAAGAPEDGSPEAAAEAVLSALPSVSEEEIELELMRLSGENSPEGRP